RGADEAALGDGPPERLARPASVAVVRRERRSRRAVELLVGRVREAGARALHEGGDLALDLLRQPEVVVVEQRDELAPRQRERLLPAPGGALRVGVADETHDVRVAADVVLDDGRRVVGRAVVDDDELERAVGLPKRRLDRLGEQLGPVPRRHEDADERLHCLRAETTSCGASRPTWSTVSGVSDVAARSRSSSARLRGCTAAIGALRRSGTIRLTALAAG